MGYGHEYRIVVVGAGGVGKSALTVRFIQGNFVEKYDPTIEDSYRKQVAVDGVACLLDIMDTAGQEEYSALRDQYMKTGQGFILAYSITSGISFETAHKLRMQILRIKEDAQDFPIMLVVTKEEGEEMAKRCKAGFIEASAKNNINVNEAFHELVRMVNTWREAHPLNGAGKKEKKGCALL